MPETYDLIVIGGGSAGLVTAGSAALLGARVALIEKKLLGGDCLYTGCVPSKTLIKSARVAHLLKESGRFGFEPAEVRFRGGRFASITERVAEVVRTIEHHDSPERFEAMGVEVVFGEPVFAGRDSVRVALRSGGERTMRARRFCIATGSRAAVPPVEGLEETGFITNEEVFQLQELPRRLIVLGGGAIGTELGQSFARFGSEVTIVEMAERVLVRDEPEASRLIEETLRNEGVRVLTGTRVLSVRRSGGAKVLECERGGETFAVEADEILVAAGRRPNVEGLDLENAGVEFDGSRVATDAYLRTSNPKIFAAGDITGHFQFTHMADYEAQVVIRNSFVPFPFKQKTDFSAVPWATFTDPEVARTGMSEAEAVDRFGAGHVRAFRSEFENNDRAQAEGATAGFAKIVTVRGRIVGATVVGEHAGEIIHEFVWAVKRRMKIGELNAIVRVYPTLSKIVQAVGTETTIETLSSPAVRRWFARYLRLWRL